MKASTAHKIRAVMIIVGFMASGYCLAGRIGLGIGIVIVTLAQLI